MGRHRGAVVSAGTSQQNTKTLKTLNTKIQHNLKIYSVIVKSSGLQRQNLAPHFNFSLILHWLALYFLSLHPIHLRIKQSQ